MNSIGNGVYAALLIPMHEDLSCDCERLVQHAQKLIDKGCSGIVLFGTMGEGTSFSVSEKITILHQIINLGLDTQKIILAICCNAIDEAVILANASLEVNTLGVLIVPPFFYKNVLDAGVIAFYREVITRVADPDLRVILYHIPQLSGVSITLHTIQVLRQEFPHTIVGFKESEGNFLLTEQILKSFPGFKVFVGSESQITDAVRKGAAGAISGKVNVFPELICSLYAAGLDSQLPDRNEELQLIREKLKGFSDIPALKSIVGQYKEPCWNRVRPPLVPLSEEQHHMLFEFLG